MECAGTEIPNLVARHYVLHWRLVCYDDHFDSAHENPHLDFASVCFRVRYSEMVSGEDLVMTAVKYILMLFQMLWGTSSLALYIPWAGSGGPYLGVSLWLWLGVLDAIQGVGLGLILLQVCKALAT